jgi:hypothetical protein
MLPTIDFIMVGSITNIFGEFKMNEFYIGLNEYRVILIENDDLSDDKILFECWAEDKDHAEEQCLNAYPSSTIIHIELLG